VTPSIDCEEKRLPWESNPGFLPLIRHLKPAINSSVLLEDIADSIDGGENPTDASLRSSLLYRCGAKGGMVPVVANTSNSAYSTPEYIASKASPDGLAIEIINICGNLCK
jgi:hypothetical protein